MNDIAHVNTDIDWHQAIKAVEKLAATRDVERFTYEDVVRLKAIADHLDLRMARSNTYAFQTYWLGKKRP